MLLREPGVQRGNGQAAHRVDQGGRQLGERSKHERTGSESGMRQLQARLVDHQVAKEHEVKIKRSRRPQLAPLATSFLLDQKKRLKQGTRGEAGLADQDAVQEWRTRRAMFWRILDKGRDRDFGQQRREPRDRVREVRLSLAEVATERDGRRARLPHEVVRSGWRRNREEVRAEDRQPALCFSLQVMQTRVHGIALSLAAATGSPQSRQTP